MAKITYLIPIWACQQGLFGMEEEKEITLRFNPVLNEPVIEEKESWLSRLLRRWTR